MEHNYKAKSKNNNQWRYGFYVCHTIAMLNPIFNGTKEEWKQKCDNNIEHCLIFDGTGDWNLLNPQYKVIIKPETLCMFSTLKDKNKNNIYENDIVKIYNEKNEVQTCIVKFNDGCFDVVNENFRDYLKVYVANHAIEVIGNEFDEI
jgi:hypothetical protein